MGLQWSEVEGIQLLDLWWDGRPEYIVIKGHHDEPTARRVCTVAAPDFKQGKVQQTYGRMVQPGEDDFGISGSGLTRVFKTGFKKSPGAMAVTLLEAPE